MMKKILIILGLFSGILHQSVYAQISSGGQPISWGDESIPLLEEKETLGFVDVAALKIQDEEEALRKDVPFHFAYGHEVNYTLGNSGSWYDFPNGDRLWRLKIESKGAISLGVTFSSYVLAEGALLYIYKPDQSEYIGAFTHLNNKESGKLGTSPLHGDQLIVEYFEPAEVALESNLAIGTVAHGYRDIFSYAENIGLNKDFGDSGSCNNDVVCPEAEDWSDQIRSVALITLENGTRLCTGTLLNNVEEDGTPYFITANHCVGAGVDTWVFIFNYESDICDPDGDGNDGSTTESVSGATLLANTDTPPPGYSDDPMDTDMAFLLLSEDVPDSYDVFYSGWDWSGMTPPSTSCIHHPSGDVKKISWDDDAPGISSYDFSGPEGGTTHWHIFEWDDGTTEGGSSGSALFNENYQVIGQLQGGWASCSNNINDYYGRLSMSFQYIDEWLDPNDSGVNNINGWPFPNIIAVDPGIQLIEGIGSNLCDANSISPSIVLKNYGLSEVTEVDIDYFLNGNFEGTYFWTGSLENLEFEVIDLGEIELDGEGEFTFSASFDYEGDLNLNNNEREDSFIAGGQILTVNIMTDDWGSETTWSIYKTDGTQIANGGPYQFGVQELYSEEVCVPDTCVTFIIYDSAGDGICCDYGEGYYTVTYSGIEVAAGAEFESQESTLICTNLIDGINEEPNTFNVKVYPNPAKDQLILTVDENFGESISIKMFNVFGQVVLIDEMNTSTQLKVFNVGNLSRGLYIVELSNGNNLLSYKVILD